jgi:hypothetical protein
LMEKRFHNLIHSSVFTYQLLALCSSEITKPPVSY